MTVRELLEKLSQFPGELTVYGDFDDVYVEGNEEDGKMIVILE